MSRSPSRRTGTPEVTHVGEQQLAAAEVAVDPPVVVADVDHDQLTRAAAARLPPRPPSRRAALRRAALRRAARRRPAPRAGEADGGADGSSGGEGAFPFPFPPPPPPPSFSADEPLPTAALPPLAAIEAPPRTRARGALGLGWVGRQQRRRRLRRRRLVVRAHRGGGERSRRDRRAPRRDSRLVVALVRSEPAGGDGGRRVGGRRRRSAAKRSGERAPSRWRRRTSRRASGAASRSRPVNGDPARRPRARRGSAARRWRRAGRSTAACRKRAGRDGGAGGARRTGAQRRGAAAGAPPPPPPPPPSLAAEPRRDADGDGASRRAPEWTAALPAASSLKPAPLPVRRRVRRGGRQRLRERRRLVVVAVEVVARGSWSAESRLAWRAAPPSRAGRAAHRIGAHPPLIAAAAAAAVPPPAEPLRGEPSRDPPPAAAGAPPRSGGRRGQSRIAEGGELAVLHAAGTPASRRYLGRQTGCCRLGDKKSLNSFLADFSGRSASTPPRRAVRNEGRERGIFARLERISRSYANRNLAVSSR